MGSDFLTAHRRLVTRDLDEAREYVSRVWERHDSWLRRGRTFFLSWGQIDFPRTSIMCIESGSPTHIVCGPVGPSYRISMHEAGTVDHLIDGRKVTSTPAHAVVYAPGQVLEMDTEPCRRLLLSFEREMVERALARRLDGRTLDPAWQEGFALDWPPAAALQSLGRWVAQEADRPDNWTFASPNFAATLERTLLALFLDCLAPPQPAGKRQRHDLSPAQLRRIEEWMSAYVHEAIGVEEMAKVAGVNVRAVQNGFRRLRGCTPTEALLRHRLQHARRTLESAAADATATVTQVAMDCGFSHLGRFAQRYAQAFGERPSDTLARNRRCAGRTRGG